MMNFSINQKKSQNVVFELIYPFFCTAYLMAGMTGRTDFWIGIEIDHIYIGIGLADITANLAVLCLPATVNM